MLLSSSSEPNQLLTLTKDGKIMFKAVSHPSALECLHLPPKAIELADTTVRAIANCSHNAGQENVREGELL